MLFSHLKELKVFIYSEPIDFRLGFERLSYFVRENLKADILEGHMYLFLGKNRKRAKVLLFDRTGLILLTKRLEGGKFMRLEDLQDAKEVTVEELNFLLAGARIRLPKRGSLKPSQSWMTV